MHHIRVYFCPGLLDHNCGIKFHILDKYSVTKFEVTNAWVNGMDGLTRSFVTEYLFKVKTFFKSILYQIIMIN